MKKVQLVCISAVFLLLAACDRAGASQPEAVSDVVPYFDHARVSVPLRSSTGSYGNIPASSGQAEEFRAALQAIPLGDFEACEPGAVLGSALQFVLENEKSSNESCKITLTTADQGGFTGSPPPADPPPAGTICLAFQFSDGNVLAYQGIYADFPYRALADLTDAVYNDTEDIAHTGAAYWLAKPEERCIISKGNTVYLRGIFEDAAANTGHGDRPAGPFDAVLELKDVTYQFDTSSGYFAREPEGETIAGKLTETDLFTVLAASGLGAA